MRNDYTPYKKKNVQFYLKLKQQKKRKTNEIKEERSVCKM